MTFQVRFAVWHGAWRFILRVRGITRVIGPACDSPVAAWVSWMRYRDDAIPEALRLDT